MQVMISLRVFRVDSTHTSAEVAKGRSTVNTYNEFCVTTYSRKVDSFENEVNFVISTIVSTYSTRID